MRLLIALCCAVLALPFAAHAQTANLIAGGDGAQVRCADDWSAVTTVPGWTVASGAPTVLCAPFTGIGASVPAFIANGPYGDSALTQIVTLPASATAAIDQGGVTYTLSGLLGGWQSAPGQAVVTATFLDSYDDPMPNAGRIAGGDAAARGGVSGVQPFTATGPVPPSARSVQVQVKFTGTAPFQSASFASGLSLTLSTPVAPPALQRVKAAVPAYDHVFLIMMENTDFDQVIGDTQDAPFINQLAAQGTLLMQSHGVYHPSDENYLAIAGGDTFVHGAIYFPDIHVDSPSLGDRLEDVHKTWKAYEQGMGKPCNLGAGTTPYYAPDDAPFANFTKIQNSPVLCRRHLQSNLALTRDLQSAATTPNFAWIAADDFHDGELPGNGSPHSLQVQDAWLRQTIGQIMGSPAWTSQRSLLILTWDEAPTYANNHIATILVDSAGAVRPGLHSYLSASHYSTGRTIEAALGLDPLTANDAYARPLNEAFGRTPQPSLSANATVPSGGRLAVTYSTPAAFLSVTNWVGVYPAGLSPSQTAPLLTQVAPATQGTISLPVGDLPVVPGGYDVWYGYDGGPTPLADPVHIQIAP